MDLVRYLVASEVTEMFMQARDNGWGYSFGNGNEGSKGEGLSRWLGYHFLAENGLDTSVLSSGGSTFFVSNSWLASSPRSDFVNHNPDDNNPDATTGCTTLFLYYLSHQLGFDITTIIANGAATLGGVYTNLTGDPGDPYPFFSRLIENSYPGTSTIGTGPNFDDPFPLGLLSFWVDKSTFGRDEVQDIIDHNGGVVSNAFWLVLEGFSIDSFNSLGVTVPLPTGPFAGLNGVTITPSPAVPGGPGPAAPIPEYEDPTNTKNPQRIRFSFDIRFTSLEAFPAVGADPAVYELDGSARVGSNPLTGATAATAFELIGGEDPYFANVDPNNAGDVFYLSQDLRVFSVTAGDAPLPGAPAFTADPYASIRSLIGYLNSTPAYTAPGGPDPLNALPGQTGYETGDSSVTPTNSAHERNYNFAVARVRLKGAGGASAENVRVFFRLFVAQSCDTDFQPGTTYLSTLGTSGPDAGRPVFPLASGTGLSDPSGQSVQTVPFFATDASGTHDYDGTAGDANIRTVTIPMGQDGVWAYYGCFLDVYDAANNARFGGTHHCVVAQIAYDQAPIPTATPTGTIPSPANCDKLAQRNLQITPSENPKSRATHRVPQAFDLRPSHPVASGVGALLDYPDELMIDWRGTPPESVAYIYWPQLDARAVLDLADGLYSTHYLSAADDHTLQCRVTRGVTYVPIPPATGVNFAGLFTVDLPATVTKGQEFNIVVRRITTRHMAVRETPGIESRPVEPSNPPPRPNPAVGPVSVLRRNWRHVTGAFQVRIPVTTSEVMLPLEEDTLAILRWRLDAMAPMSRWRPVIEKQLELVAARVDGLGGNSADIPPSLGGAPRRAPEPGPGGKPGHPGEPGHPGKPGHPGEPGEPEEGHRQSYTGKVLAITYDRFGDFEGFTILTESGHERSFRGREEDVEELVRQAWSGRFVVTVVVENGDDRWPASIRLRRPAS